MSEQADELLQRLSAEVKSLHVCLKELDDGWRSERQRLQEELRDAARRVQRERHSLTNEIRETAKSLKEEIRQLRRAPRQA